MVAAVVTLTPSGKISLMLKGRDDALREGEQVLEHQLTCLPTYHTDQAARPGYLILDPQATT